MPIAKFQLPDGRVAKFEVPDGTTPEQAQAVFDEFVRTVPAEPSAYERTAAEQSGLDNFLAGAGGSMYGMYLGAKQMIGAADQKEVDEHKRAMQGLNSTASGTAGAITGAAVPAAATAWIPGANSVTGAALVGAGMGALEPTAQGDSRIANMAAGAALGGAAQKGAQAIGRLVRPVQSQLTPEMSALAARADSMGIPLNAAQRTGSRPLAIIDSVLDNMPLTADRQAAMKDAAKQRFNRAVGKTFGADAARLSKAELESAKRAIGDEFTTLASRNTLTLDNTAIGDLVSLTDDLQKFDTPDVAKIVSNYVDDLLAKAEGDRVAGEAYRKFDSALGRKMRSTSNGDLRHALGRLQETVRGAMDRSISTADADAWKAARAKYRNLMSVEQVALKDVEGNVSPKLLWNAVNKKGSKELRDVAEVGRAFVNSTPDSGTAQRSFYQRFIENPLTATWQQGVGGISLPLQSLLNTPAGQQYFTRGLLEVSPGVARLGRASAVGLPMGLLNHE